MKFAVAISAILAALEMMPAEAQTLDTRIFASSYAASGIYRDPVSGQLQVDVGNHTPSSGSDWGYEARGVIEFPLANFNPLPGTTVRLDMKDVGGSNGPESNSHFVKWYVGDGVAKVDDWGRPASTVRTVNSPRNQTFQTIPIDVTSAASSYATTSGSHVGFRFEPAAAHSFEDFGRASSFNSSIVASMVVSDDPMDVFRNSAGIDVTASDQSPVIDIHFTPRNSLGQAVSVSTLKSALGVDSFNWISRVVDFPDSWRRTEVWADLDWAPNTSGVSLPDAHWDAASGFFRHNRDNSPVIAFPVSEGMVDLPPREPSSNSSTFMYLTDAGQWVGWNPDPAITGLDHDELDFYYGLGDTPTGGGEISFYDRPLQPVGALLPGEYIEWQTELVGVMSNGAPFRSGLVVSWKSNALANGLGGVVQGGAAPGFGIGEYVSGGIFDVRIEVVPEPSSFALLVSAVIVVVSLAWWNYRKGNNASTTMH